MAGEHRSKAKPKTSYGEKMRKKLADARAESQAKPTKKRAKKAKKMRK
jgi:hypothetical protein